MFECTNIQIMCGFYNCLSGIIPLILLFVEPLILVIVESILVGVNRGDPIAYTTILICSLIQIILASFGGMSVYYFYYSDDGIMAFFFNPFTVLDRNRSMLPRDIFILVMLLGWIPTNLICTWVNAAVSLPSYINIMAYVPIMAWIIGMVVGYYKHQTKPEYSPV